MRVQQRKLRQLQPITQTKNFDEFKSPKFSLIIAENYQSK